MPRIITIPEIKERMGTPRDRGFCEKYSFSRHRIDSPSWKNFDFVVSERQNGFHLRGDVSHRGHKANLLFEEVKKDFYIALRKSEIIPSSYTMVTLNHEGGRCFGHTLKKATKYLVHSDGGEICDYDSRFALGVSFDNGAGFYPYIQSTGNDFRHYLIGGYYDPSEEFDDARTHSVVTAYLKTLIGFRRTPEEKENSKFDLRIK